MATIHDLAIKYANKIYQSGGSLSSIEEVKLQIKNLTSNGKPISLELQEKLWNEIEKKLASKRIGLFENQNTNFLSAISAIKRDIKLKKSKEDKGSK